MTVQIRVVYDGNMQRLNAAILRTLDNVTVYERHRVHLEIDTPEQCGEVSLQARTLDDDAVAFRLWVEDSPGKWKVGTLVHAIEELANHPAVLPLSAVGSFRFKALCGEELVVDSVFDSTGGWVRAQALGATIQAWGWHTRNCENCLATLEANHE